jgi:PleD family two-component response regulator
MRSTTKPLAIVAYERLMPGSQLGNRLQDLGYRVKTVTDYSALFPAARDEKPMVMILDLKTSRSSSFEPLQQIRSTPETSHIPILGFAPKNSGQLEADAFKAGASLVALDDALLPQLPHLLEQILAIE